jgi:hypothetical protein
MAFTTREGWLVAAIKQLNKEFFKGSGYSLPEKLGVSCGFAKAQGHRAIGQCWDPSAAKDQTTHMFICPTLDDPMTVLGTLLHELIHAAVGIKEGHRGKFRKLALEFGLAGKMTATYVPEESELGAKIRTISGKLGPYPHGAMTVQKGRALKGRPWMRFRSGTAHSYVVIVSPKQVDEYGVPKDPWGDEMHEEVK